MKNYLLRFTEQLITRKIILENYNDPDEAERAVIQTPMHRSDFKNQ